MFGLRLISIKHKESLKNRFLFFSLGTNDARYANSVIIPEENTIISTKESHLVNSVLNRREAVRIEADKIKKAYPIGLMGVLIIIRSIRLVIIECQVYNPIGPT